ncbi:MAG: hypothetical protein AABY64_09525 [Bdellovibrionota bacterium]
MIQYYTPSSWFWIFVAFLICCAFALSKDRRQPLVNAVQQASTELIKVIDR